MDKGQKYLNNHCYTVLHGRLPSTGVLFTVQKRHSALINMKNSYNLQFYKLQQTLAMDGECTAMDGEHTAMDGEHTAMDGEHTASSAQLRLWINNSMGTSLENIG